MFRASTTTLGEHNRRPIQPKTQIEHSSSVLKTPSLKRWAKNRYFFLSRAEEGQPPKSLLFLHDAVFSLAKNKNWHVRGICGEERASSLPPSHSLPACDCWRDSGWESNERSGSRRRRATRRWSYQLRDTGIFISNRRDAATGCKCVCVRHEHL